MLTNLKINKICIKLILMTVAFANPVAYADYSEKRTPEVGREIKIEFINNDAGKFQNEISEIKSRPGNIRQWLKKEYRVNIKSTEVKNGQCEGRIKINGDWQDHIDAAEGITSLNVELINDCYIGGIGKFKLLLPRTRNNENEIFWSMLLNYHGFPTLYTKYIDVTFNDKKYTAIFQEKPSSYFLERHGIRESPILEQDERNFWTPYAFWYEEVHEKKSSTVSDVWHPIGLRLSDDRIDPMDVDLSYGRLVNKEFLGKESNIETIMISLNEYRNPKKNIINGQFYDAITSRFAEHGFGNGTYIYIPYINSFLRLYYDGNVKTFPEASCELGEVKDVPEIFSREYEKRVGSKLNESMVCVFNKVELMKHMSKWEDLEYYKSVLPINYENMKSPGTLRTGFKGLKNVYVYSNGGRYYENDPNLNKEVEINKDQLTKILKGKSTKIINGIKIPVVVLGEISAEAKTKFIIASGESDQKFRIDEGVTYIYSKAASERAIHVNLNGVDSKVVLMGNFGSQDTVNITGSSTNPNPGSRHDSLMLTGCSTFYNSTFDRTSIISNAVGCEDSVNLLNSQGVIGKINIFNSTEDGLDADFSMVDIADANVVGAGNDCVDLSSGTYTFGNVNTYHCKDKSVSVGEGANVQVGKVHIEKSNLGIVVKDGSSFIADTLSAKNVVGKCIETQSKKPRYGIANYIVTNTNCN